MIGARRLVVNCVRPSVGSFSTAAEAKLATGSPRKARKPMGKRPVVVEQRARNTSLENSAKAANLPWRIVGSTILHRYPVIAKEMTEPWELKMHELQDKIEGDRRKWLMEKIQGTSAQIIPDSELSYEEIIDSMPFKPASRRTEADEKNDRKSLDRRLDDSLFLVVKRNRTDHFWQFPQGKWLNEETMRVTAERVLERAIGKVDTYFISNAPAGHFCYEYPAALKEQRKNFGAQVFFYRAQYLGGKMKFETRLYKDYAWIARDEVDEYFDKDSAKFFKALLPY